MSSPENLGKVVDIKLREQILRNENLLDQYNQVQLEKSELNRRIEEYTQKINALESECRQFEDDNFKNIKRYEDKLEELAALSEESETNLKELQLLRNEFDVLMTKVSESYERIGDLESAKSSLQDELNVCENEVIKLKDSNKKIATENADHLLQIERLTVIESRLKLEAAKNEDLVNRLQSSILELQVQIEKSHEREIVLQSEVDRLTKLLDDFQSQIDRLEKDSQTLSKDYTIALNERDYELKKLQQDRDERINELEHQVKLVR